VNVLKSHLQITIRTLLGRGESYREIERLTGVSRKTVCRYQRDWTLADAKFPTLATGAAPEVGSDSAGEIEMTPPRPPGFSAPSSPASTASPPRVPLTPSACEPHREWITAQVQLGRNAVSMHQDLITEFGFTHAYNSVKRFVNTLKVREPERFDVLEYPPGEEAQVDFGQGAMTLHDAYKYRRPWLFVMTLKYSGKSFRKVVWKADTASWVRLHEEAFLSFGGSVRYVVLDNLKQGVLKPDLYDPTINPVYAAMLAHYGSVADACRVRDPNRKGTVESAIQHTQGTALKGRTFESIELQNVFLAQWEERFAAPRIHGRKKRQVLAMFAEEKPHLLPLPMASFQLFTQSVRTVDDAGLVQIEGRYYAALPAPLHTEVTVRVYATEVQILDARGTLLRHHPKAERKGQFVMEEKDRLFNPSRETARLLGKIAKIGPSAKTLSLQLFERGGRAEHKALYALSNLTRHHTCVAIDAACHSALTLTAPRYQDIKRILERTGVAHTSATQSTAQKSASAVQPTLKPTLKQAGAEIRSLTEYQAFFDEYTQFCNPTLNTGATP
jgi:transposase